MLNTSIYIIPEKLGVVREDELARVVVGLEVVEARGQRALEVDELCVRDSRLVRAAVHFVGERRVQESRDAAERERVGDERRDDAHELRRKAREVHGRKKRRKEEGERGKKRKWKCV